uniref:Uncharacterized protein n=1 Tax=Leersia perrieri TaxID=77586 RepID=A0A0D9VEN8_9ORYZ
MHGERKSRRDSTFFSPPFPLGFSSLAPRWSSMRRREPIQGGEAAALVESLCSEYTDFKVRPAATAG